MSPIRHSSEDLVWMRRALDLGHAMRGHVWPNPPVGCVIVREDCVVAEAATQPGGRPHAERKALDAAGASANGATLYVTLEPCCHWGKTPPCVEAIIEAGVSRVVAATRDPDPRVNGGGFVKLRAAGVAVSVGACAEEAERLMSGFFNRVQHGTPEVVVVDAATTELPTGVDALVNSSQHGIRVLARSRDVDLPEGEPRHLLERLGEVGLTSVAVPAHDPLLHVLATKAKVAASVQ